jgi:hypothetical protein
MIPKNINKEHIISAINEIDKNGIRKGRHSSTYDVLFNKKLYPPKLLISLANKYVNGTELDHNTFSGGPGKEAFKLLESLDFYIVEKNNNTNDFKKYLLKFHKNKSTTTEYIKMMPKIEKWFISSGIVSSNFKIWEDVSKINEINSSLKSKYNSIWKDLNKKENNWYSSPWNKWVNFNLETKPNYWIFQGNPKVFDFETALRDDIISDWTVSAHKDKIKIGDKVILWITGTKSGCYALAEVTSSPHNKSHSTDDKLWKTDNKNQLKVDIKITHNLIKSPILKSDIELFEEFNELKAGNQGTNFSATKKEYNTFLSIGKKSNIKQYWLYSPGEKAYKWDEFNKDNILGLGWDKLGDLRKYKSRNEIRDALKSAYGGKGDKKNDVTANDDFINKVNIGDIVIVKKGKKELLGYGEIRSDYYFDEKRNDYKSCRKIDWKLKGNWKIKGNMVVKTFTDITSYKSIDSDYETYYERLLGVMGYNNNTKKISKMNLSLNTILYGPPGTGKTYRLKNEFFNKFIDESSIKTKEEFLKELVSEFSWWEVIAASLHIMQKAKVAQISEHPLIKAKVANSSNNNIRATIWGTLQAHTVQECEYVNVESRQVPLIFSKNEDSIWEVLPKNLESEAPEVIELVSKSKEFKPQTFSKKRYVFTTFHQSFSYEDFIEGIKPVVYENEQNSTLGKQVVYEIKPGLFKQIVKDANADRDNDYAIFIDEINRGNIANIFGELITLIEDDKRIDTDNYIPAKLPYSNENFGVPPNLYIIGTMNTADRSVEALDTALRRRFSFIEMNPEPSKLSSAEFKCDGIDLESLLISINSRIEKLLDKDYCIGHSYFMTIKNRKQPLNEIKAIFKNKILPLLQEYFYGDWGKIMLVIGKEFVEMKKGDIKFLSTDSYDEFEEYDEKPIYNFTNSSQWTLDSFLSIYE